MQETSRIAAGRERAAVAKRAVAFAAAGCFAAVLVLARTTHPGATATGSTLSPPTALLSQIEAGSSLSGGSIGSAVSAPSVSTSTS
ncbi:MAG: hypothetical protein ABSB24_10735 [Gaiellaceae bacterium]|jgi:hypothetical protein